MSPLSLENFAETIGEPYLVDTGEVTQALVLENATPLHDSGRAGGAFRLEFRGPAEPVLPQSIHALKCGNHAYEIFLVPVGRDAAGTSYEAVFY